MDKIVALVKSRRFWAGLAGVVHTYVATALEVPDGTIAWVNGLITAWILGDSINKTK